MNANVAVVLLLCVVGAHATIWSSCGTSPPIFSVLRVTDQRSVPPLALRPAGTNADHIKVNNVVMYPDPPQRASPCNITLWGELGTSVACAVCFPLFSPFFCSSSLPLPCFIFCL